MISKEYSQLLARHLAAENSHKMEETLATLTSDCIFNDTALGKTFHGRQGAAEYYHAWWQAFDMTVHTEHRYYPSSTQVIVETHFKGKHVGDFFGLKATGHLIDLPIVVIIDLKDGLLAGERFYWDKAKLFQQIGLSIPKLVF